VCFALPPLCSAIAKFDAAFFPAAVTSTKKQAASGFAIKPRLAYVPFVSLCLACRRKVERKMWKMLIYPILT